MSIKVFIDGAEGTTGLRLADRLTERNDVELITIDSELRKDSQEKARLSNSADIVFLCLPDDAARTSVAGITNPDVKIIDASTAHRASDDWAYGLPGLSNAQRGKIAASKRVTVPGCHATGFISLVYPIVSAGIASPDYPFTDHSVTGYSGGGKNLIAKYENKDRSPCFDTPAQYALGQKHKHLPEMQKHAGISYPPVFNPILGDFYAGMAVSVPLHTRLLNKPMGAKELHDFFADYYAGQNLIRVMPWGAHENLENAMLDAGALAGLDIMEIYICGHENQTVLISRFDNLGKGASGAAVQCMNIMSGLPETAGLAI